MMGATGVSERRTLKGQIGAFGIIGVLATACHFAVLTSLHVGLGMNATVGTVIAFFVSLNLSFFGQRAWVFESQRSIKEEIFRFITVASVGGILNAGIMLMLSDIIGVPYYVSFIVATVLIPALTFVFNKFWVFKKV